MRWVSERFGPDELIGMAYYGEGMGRYFAGNTSGQDALSNIGLPGAAAGVSLDPVPTYGATAAYRRFWTPQLRSNLSYSYARQDYPNYALASRRARPRRSAEPRDAAGVREPDLEPLRHA